MLIRWTNQKKSSGKCVLVSGAWYSPSEVEALGGKKAKKMEAISATFREIIV
jgi:hypothetical protein